MLEAQEAEQAEARANTLVSRLHATHKEIEVVKVSPKLAKDSIKSIGEE